MNSLEATNFKEMAQELCSLLTRKGKIVSTPRTGEFLELRNVVYTVRRPLDRLLPYKSLKQVKLWAYGEVLTEFLGLNPPIMEDYTNQDTKKFMETFHRQDGRANYTYGERWHNAQAFQKIVQRLKEDRYSRQALMNIWDSTIDLQSGESNVPCTIIHQFMIRNERSQGTMILPDQSTDKLHTNVYIRSNDFFKGWKYDIFLNSFIHEAFAGFVDAEPGDLTFMVGSFHAYKSDYDKLDSLLDECDIPDEPQQPHFKLGFEELYKNLWGVKSVADASKYMSVFPAMKTTFNNSIQFSGQEPIFQEWAKAYVEYNSKRSYDNAGKNK